MKPSDQDRLLRELLGDESLDHLRRDSLAGALAALRTRRRRRAALSGTATVVTLLLAFGLAWHRRLAHEAENTGRMPGPQLAAQNATGASRLHPDGDPADTVPKVADTGVQLINDEELFALFPGRSMALIGPPGAQQFVFLDRPTGQAEETAGP